MIHTMINLGEHEAWISEDESGDFYLNISYTGKDTEDGGIDDGVTILLSQTGKLVDFIKGFKEVQGER